MKYAAWTPIANAIICNLNIASSAIALAGDPSFENAAALVVDRLSCGIKLKPGPKTPPPAPSGCSLPGAVGSFFSFEGETVVEAIEGQKKIRDIAVGDLVASRDAFTGAKTFRPVTDLFRRTAPGIVHVTLDGPDGKRETLDVTSEHPLFAEGKGWTQVRRLQKGDRVLSGKGGPLAVADIVHDNTPTLVYNFQVAQDHSYFAGSEGAWSHNYTFGQLRRAYIKACALIGGCNGLTKYVGKFGSPSRGDEKCGIRLDGKGPDPHINAWDYRAGKRNRGGFNEHVRIE